MKYTDTYGNKFFRRRHKFEQAEQEIAQILIEHFNPVSVLDLGCGIGSFLNLFHARGIEVAGCDVGYSHAVKYMQPEIIPHTFGFDLGTPLQMPKKYDLVMSVEVAEHLPEEAAGQFCQNIVSNAFGWIFLTASNTSAGKGHINPQENQYWIEMMTANGAEYQQHKTNLLREDLGGLMGLKKLAMVFKMEGA